MRHAEEVVFGGSGLDRAAELRGDVGAQAALLTDAAARGLVVWRGKLLVTGDDAVLARVAMDHPILAEAAAAPIFLGREPGPVFAYDISHWAPEGLESAQMGSFLDRSEQVHPACAPGERFVELRTLLTRLTARDAELAATAKGLFAWHASHGFCARCGAATEMFKAGWERVCPACGAHHFPRTDPVVIMLITRGNSCLLGRSHGWPEGMYSCLAGFVEPGETLEAAVRREVFEESGIRVGRVRYLASQPWPFPASLMMGCHGEALPGEISIDPEEIEHAMWVSREEVADAFAGRNPGLLPARKGAIAHFLLRNWLADRLE